MQSLFGRHRQALATAAYAAAITLSLGLAFALHRHALIPGMVFEQLGFPLFVLLGLRLAIHRLLRLTMGRWRYVGIPDLFRLVASATVGSAAFAVVNSAGIFLEPVPTAVLFTEWVFTIFLTATLWISYRAIFEISRTRADAASGNLRRTIIIGAGELGSLLAREIGRAPTGLKMVGFVDDDPATVDASILGHQVLGSTRELPAIVTQVSADLIIIAIPSADPVDLRRVVEACEETSVDFRVLPGISNVFAGDVGLRNVRRVTIEDLLGRTPVSLDLPELGRELDGGVALVTGAAGSIGSELARQIAVNAPKTLILLDQAESDLFFVELELQDRHPDLDIQPVIADIRDADRMDDVVGRFGVTHVYHAAAYKHVPLMERNVSEAIRNNVCGTKNLLEAAGRLGVRSFVLISTDKAVNPSSVMGATKRVCELLMLGAAERYPETGFTAVRFGNVLGSNGSVVQIFRKQMDLGRLTVTHPDITRYFMTVSEAVQLVLTAASMPEANGRIAMLEMGAPVRIMDLAQNMIRLSGLREGTDVNIEVTGLRPGEKLHEELVSSAESTEATPNGKIQLVRTGSGPLDVAPGIERLLELANGGDSDLIREFLFEIVTESHRTVVL